MLETGKQMDSLYDRAALCVEYGLVACRVANFDDDIDLDIISSLLNRFAEKYYYSLYDLEAIFYIEKATLKKVLEGRHVGSKTKEKIYSILTQKGELNLI